VVWRLTLALKPLRSKPALSKPQRSNPALQSKQSRHNQCLVLICAAGAAKFKAG
jgi:hypothetical protein